VLNDYLGNSHDPTTEKMWNSIRYWSVQEKLIIAYVEWSSKLRPGKSLTRKINEQLNEYVTRNVVGDASTF
jgi:hypothetical protein